MQTIIGVRFKKAGKIFYFSPGHLEITQGDRVVVETSRGVECGTAVVGPREVEDSEIKAPLKVVLRIATENDLQRIEENKKSEQEAFGICESKIAEHGLPMKLVEVEYTFDLSKIIFYFTADGRIDFRDLVKDLASVFRTRIELRQIGVRDEAKLMGGIGCCGRPLCCASFLGDFEPVSIRMAKEQNLSLNPTKISGICGRLMCCLKYENDCYEAGICGGACRKTARIQEPEQGSRVISAEGEGKVISVNQQKRTATILLDNSRTIVASWEDVVSKDEDEMDNTAPSRTFRRNYDDDDDEADESLLAALTERSARAESLGEEEEGSHHGRGRDRKAGDRERRPRSEGGRPRDRRKRPEGSREGRNAQKGERRSRDNEGERNFRRERSERSSKNRPRRPRRDREHRNREDRHQEQGE